MTDSTITRRELVADVAQRAEVTQAVATAVLDALDDSLAQAATDGATVRFGSTFTMERVERVERTGRNPRTGEPLVIPARAAVKLTPGAALKRAVAGEDA